MAKLMKNLAARLIDLQLVQASRQLAYGFAGANPSQNGREQPSAPKRTTSAQRSATWSPLYRDNLTAPDNGTLAGWSGQKGFGGAGGQFVIRRRDNAAGPQQDILQPPRFRVAGKPEQRRSPFRLFRRRQPKVVGKPEISLVPSDTVNATSLAEPQLQSQPLTKKQPKHGYLTAGLVAGLAILTVTVHAARWQKLSGRYHQMQGVIVEDASGVEGGALLREGGLRIRDASGRFVPMLSLPVRTVPADFMLAAYTLEGRGVLGVNQFNLMRAALCWPLQKIGLNESDELRLKNGRCGGGSTLAVQAVRSLTGENERSPTRKFFEALDATALSVFTRAGSEENSRVIANSLHFGYARGLPITGVRNAAGTIFGKSEAELELEESAVLSGMLLFPVALRCGQSREEDIARFNRIRTRALYALDRGFRDDPRYAAARARLLAMEPITAPAPSPEARAAGLDEDAACRAGANPILRLEELDSGAKLAAARALKALGDQAPLVSHIQLSTRFREQVAFKSGVDRARGLIASGQQGHWLVNPNGMDVSILAFTTGQGGILTGLYESTANAQIYQERDLGSLAKIPALLFLAERGWTTRDMFCNRSTGSLSNAGGDRGVADCANSPEGVMTVEQVWSKSISLAVLDALRRYPAPQLRERMAELGISLPDGVEPAYAVAFGLARATPARMEAIFAGVSAGVAGEPAVGYDPRIIASYRLNGQHRQPWRSSYVDLRASFTSPESRRLIAAGASAAYLPHGTLSSIGPVPTGSVGKTGTLDTDQRGQVRFKAASGAWAGAGWFTMTVPARGALGDSSISIIPLAQVVRGSMMRQQETDLPASAAR